MRRLDMSLYPILRRILIELNEQIVDHGERVAYLFLKMAQFRNTPDNLYLEHMMLACFAHDIGAYKTEKFLDLLKFDVKHTLEHCIYGYLFMKYFSPLGDDAEVLLYHHTYYDEKEKYPDNSYIDDGILIHLLDRVDIFNLKHEDVGDVLWQLKNGAGRNFDPKDVDDFIRAEEKYNIIESLRDGTYKVDVINYFNDPERIERLISPIVDMLAIEVDFKSEQTVIHTITITTLTEILGKKLGLSDDEIWETAFAARIHDLGKINIPSSILEKQGKLTPEEYAQMKKHVLYTELIATGLFPRNVVSIAAKHHERLDGSGYPRGLTSERLTIEDRLVQVTDVVSALLQKRSYKDSMEKEKVIEILSSVTEAGQLDKTVVELLISNYDDIIQEVLEKSAKTIEIYEGLNREYSKYLKEYSSEERDAMEEFGLFSSLNNTGLSE